MKKIIYTTAIFGIICLATQPAFSNSNFNEPCVNTDKGGDDKEISIVPDRASGEAQVRFKSAKEGEASITVLDEAGKIVLQQSNKLSAGINNLPIINVLKLSEGFYTVRLVTNNQTYNSRFLLWK